MSQYDPEVERMLKHPRRKKQTYEAMRGDPTAWERAGRSGTPMPKMPSGTIDPLEAIMQSIQVPFAQLRTIQISPDNYKRVLEELELTIIPKALDMAAIVTRMLIRTLILNEGEPIIAPTDVYGVGGTTGPWEPLKPITKKIRRRRGDYTDYMLYETGNLYNSINWDRVNPLERNIGVFYTGVTSEAVHNYPYPDMRKSVQRYAWIQEFGGTIPVSQKMREFMKIHFDIPKIGNYIYIPERSYLRRTFDFYWMIIQDYFYLTIRRIILRDYGGKEI